MNQLGDVNTVILTTKVITILIIYQISVFLLSLGSSIFLLFLAGLRMIPAVSSLLEELPPISIFGAENSVSYYCYRLPYVLLKIFLQELALNVLDYYPSPFLFVGLHYKIIKKK